MPELQRQIERHRGQLAAGERGTARDLAGLYRPVYERVRVESARLLRQIEEQTGPVPLSWLHERNRLRDLERAIRVEMNTFSRAAGGRIEEAAVAAGSLGANHAAQLVPGATLPVPALRALAAATAEGPLRQLLESLVGPLFSQVRDELAHGILTGANPRDVATRINKASGLGLVRAMTISRTEMLRSYREGQRATFQESDTVKGWYWFSALQPGRTCAACWAMHGTRHTLRERLDGHPNCRCTMMPDVGQGQPATGVELFGRLATADKRAILGAAGLDAFSAGRVALPDFVRRTRNRKWGTTRTRAPLRDALARNRA